MAKDLRMEVFASKDVVKPTSLHVYELHTQEIDNRYKIIRSAVWKIRSHSQAGVFEDGEKNFSTKGIEYSIIEVKKNTYSKLMLLQDGKALNPAMGCCIYNQNKGYLITTDIKDDKGSPNPILIEKKCGDISMEDVFTQILYLSQLHVGSTHKMRLPITTGYADKICKNRDFVPEGQMDDRLFFL